MSGAARQYLRQVKQQLLCPRAIRRDFLCQLQEELISYCADHPQADAAALACRFGEPDEVAADFLIELGTPTLNRFTRDRKRLLCAAGALLLVVSVFTALLGVRSQLMHHQLEDGFIAAVIGVEDDSQSPSPTQQIIFDSEKGDVLQEPDDRLLRYACDED